MLFSAVVLSCNAESHLEACIESLVAAFSEFEDSEIFVVENGSADRSAEILKRLEGTHPSLIRARYHPVNTGTTVSRNWAIREATGKYVLIIDVDATVSAEALRGLVAVLNEHPDCGIAVPRLLYPNGKLQLSTDSFPTLQRKLSRAFNLRKIEAVESVPAHRVPVDYAISAFWLVPRKVFDEVGLLDERIFYSPEDVDFCLRVWKAGYRVIYESAVTAVHDAQELSRGYKLNAFTFSHLKGLAYYFLKHRYLLRAPRFDRDR